MSAPARVRGRVSALRRWSRRAGWCAAAEWAALRIALRCGMREPAFWHVQPRQAEHTVQLRLRGSSDLQVFEEIFVDDVYAGLRDLREPAVILDLGANIGLSSAYFLSAFPGTRVIAVEPDERNLAVCRANLAAYGERATVMAGAVWRSCGRLRLVRGEFGDGREWATQVAEESDGVSAAGAVTAWDMPALIALNRAASIDLLKVNIERAELAVFGPGSAVWLARVRNICIELHGPECEAAFFGALSGFEYDLLRTGEWTICRNLRPKATP